MISRNGKFTFEFSYINFYLVASLPEQSTEVSELTQFTVVSSLESIFPQPMRKLLLDSCHHAWITQDVETQQFWLFREI